ncbi:MAG: thiolase C-terminal domain-containing protein, partial [Roseiflexus sp.]
MRHVYIIGTGATAVGEHWDRNAASLAVEALTGALGTIPASRLGALYVACALSGTLHAQSQIGALIATTAGIPGVESITVEAGGASGGVALRQACMAVASGAVDLAAVVGVEKVTDVLDVRREAALALATDADWE